LTYIIDLGKFSYHLDIKKTPSLVYK
jgi:hypothetical protein